LAVLSLFVLALIVFRMFWYPGVPQQGGIAWNLFLAWIPFVVALLVHERPTLAPSTPAFAAACLLWLVFLPNAPYLVTDLKYVGGHGGVPVLYDLVLLSAAAWAGLLLGLTSLFFMHVVWRRLIGVARAWAFVVAVLALSSFGIYLGRVQRWNSWDLVTRPGSLLGQIAEGLLEPESHARPMGLTVLLTSFLLASYLVFYSFARLSSSLSD
jgi:uncharacterized membrane protein